jgi:hypothetical protein
MVENCQTPRKCQIFGCRARLCVRAYRKTPLLDTKKTFQMKRAKVGRTQSARAADLLPVQRHSSSFRISTSIDGIHHSDASSFISGRPSYAAHSAVLPLCLCLPCFAPIVLSGLASVPALALPFILQADSGGHCPPAHLSR